MKRKKFFLNMDNIAKFGVIGTILTFIFYSTLTYGAVLWLEIKLPITELDENLTPVIVGMEQPNIIEILFISSLLCSSDIIAAVTIVNEHD